MGTFFILIVSSLAGSVGWWLGSFIGMGSAFLLSIIGSFVGLYYGCKWNGALFS